MVSEKNKSLFLKFGGAFLTVILFAGLTKGKPPGLADSEDEIASLHPRLQKLARRFIYAAHRAGIDIVLTSGHRSHEKQGELYEQGRTTPGPIVTKAKPGHSWHNHRLAFDVAILSNGQPTWPSNPDIWRRLGKLGAKLGLKHGASFGDNPHFDYHPRLTINEAIRGNTLV